MRFGIQLKWTGNRGEGTNSYRGYDRNFEFSTSTSGPVLGSSAEEFLGDVERINPEEMFLASLSSCHMLWFLHLCADSGVVVLDYQDSAKGKLIMSEDGSGRFASATLFPRVVVKDTSMVQKAQRLHKEANVKCFIANSCNFEVKHEAEISVPSY